jgi:hypothetical protein
VVISVQQTWKRQAVASKVDLGMSNGVVSNSYHLDAGLEELLMLLGQLPKLPSTERSPEAP